MKASKYQEKIIEIQRLMEEQKGICVICEKPFATSKGRHLDHCHRTGKIRALLCTKCNVGLGYFEDNAYILERAKIYIKFFERKFKLK